MAQYYTQKQKTSRLFNLLIVALSMLLVNNNFAKRNSNFNNKLGATNVVISESGQLSFTRVSIETDDTNLDKIRSTLAKSEAKSKKPTDKNQINIAAKTNNITKTTKKENLAKNSKSIVTKFSKSIGKSKTKNKTNLSKLAKATNNIYKQEDVKLNKPSHTSMVGKEANFAKFYCPASSMDPFDLMMETAFNSSCSAPKVAIDALMVAALDKDVNSKVNKTKVTIINNTNKNESVKIKKVKNKVDNKKENKPLDSIKTNQKVEDKTSSQTNKTNTEVASSYTTKKDVTLWRIAREHTTNNNNIAKMAQAIFNQNKQAFINENINLLQVGAKINIPNEARLNKKDIKSLVVKQSTNLSKNITKVTFERADSKLHTMQSAKTNVGGVKKASDKQLVAKQDMSAQKTLVKKADKKLTEKHDVKTTVAVKKASDNQLVAKQDMSAQKTLVKKADKRLAQNPVNKHNKQLAKVSKPEESFIISINKKVTIKKKVENKEEVVKVQKNAENSTSVASNTNINMPQPTPLKHYKSIVSPNSKDHISQDLVKLTTVDDDIRNNKEKFKNITVKLASKKTSSDQTSLDVYEQLVAKQKENQKLKDKLIMLQAQLKSTRKLVQLYNDKRNLVSKRKDTKKIVSSNIDKSERAPGLSSIFAPFSTIDVPAMSKVDDVK